MRKAYTFRLYPTAAQAVAMQRQLNIAREVYNACLEERRACYRTTGKSLTYYDQANQLKAIRQECPDVAVANFSMLQATCRRAQRTYDNFYRRVKAGLKGGVPRYKGYHRFDSITFPSYGDGCKLTDARLKLQGVGSVKVKLHRPLEGAIKTVTLKRDIDKWSVVFSCDIGDVPPLPPTGESVGIDVGLSHFLTTDTGTTDAQRSLAQLPRLRAVAAARSGQCHAHQTAGAQPSSANAAD